ncbi:SoxR reducing system RseC family protein [Aromatoleum toluclasticum]|uniref:SoxR reducing system RseC family protein n=1 Tax=Aromatoleum toluclasticum TaxID=92003 RepID=UPI0003614980|nr:SoxR reducing system RseC family protein [Aromatoleum toluclasticum]
MSGVLTHEGVVRSVEGGRALVAVPVQGCSSCGERSRCGVGKLAGGAKVSLVTVPACDGLAPGDAVTLAADPDAINRAALLGYLLPALLIVAGAVGGDRLAHTDVAAVLGAFGGLVLGVLVTRMFRAASVPLELLRRGRAGD